MSDTDTGLFLPGLHDVESIAPIVWSAPGVSTNDFIGTEAVRVGSASLEGVEFTHVGVRVFEAGGLLILQEDVPPPEDLELWLGQTLSERFGLALFLQYDGGRRIGGHALFRDGELVSRRVVDGRTADPVLRELTGSEPLDLSPEQVWPRMAQAVSEGAVALFAHPVATPEALAAVIDTANGEPLDAPADLDRAPEPPPKSRRRDRLKRALGSLLGRD